METGLCDVRSSTERIMELVSTKGHHMDLVTAEGEQSILIFFHIGLFACIQLFIKMSNIKRDFTKMYTPFLINNMDTMRNSGTNPHQ